MVTLGTSCGRLVPGRGCWLGRNPSQCAWLQPSLLVLALPHAVRLIGHAVTRATLLDGAGAADLTGAFCIRHRHTFSSYITDLRTRLHHPGIWVSTYVRFAVTRHARREPPRRRDRATLAFHAQWQRPVALQIAVDLLPVVHSEKFRSLQRDSLR